MTDTELKSKLYVMICMRPNMNGVVNDVLALINQSNREYADTLIGEDDPITLPEKPNMDANPPQWEQLDKWILDMNTRRNELRAELRKKNENT